MIKFFWHMLWGHDWYTYREENLLNGSGAVVGLVVIYKCSKCNMLKREDL